ncbi:multicopper oxidase domain-containing protein [Mycolicibacterium fluoranthenivorans]
MPRTGACRAVADYPGIWTMHWHSTYHQAAGMMTRLDYPPA